jgi:hypothetical protein
MDRQQKREHYNTKRNRRSDFPITSGRSCAGRIHANKSDMLENMRMYVPTTLPLTNIAAMLLTLPRTDAKKLLHTTVLCGDCTELTPYNAPLPNSQKLGG